MRTARRGAEPPLLVADGTHGAERDVTTRVAAYTPSTPAGRRLSPLDAASKTHKRWINEVRALIILALILELKSPRMGSGDFRITLAVFAVAVNILLLHRMRDAIQNLGALITWPTAALTAYCAWVLSSAFWSRNPGETLLQSGLIISGLVVAASYAHIPPVILAREFTRPRRWWP